MKSKLGSRTVAQGALLLLVVVAHLVTTDLIDPCEDHLYIDDPYALRSAGNSTVPLFHNCDSRITEDWHRVRSPAGTDIPTECVASERCSTLGTIWMDGPIPTDDIIHDRTVYVVTGTDCKDTTFSFQIQVKNCDSILGSYRVYNLKRPEGCPMAYCFGKEMPCPAGTSSDSGFGPNCIDPASRTPFTPTPTVDFDVQEDMDGDGNVVRRELLFVCKWTHSEDHQYDVEWYKKDMMIVKAGNVRESKHLLKESDWYKSGRQNLGHEIYCRVRAIAPGYTHPSMYSSSNKFYAGIKILTKNLEVTEGESVPLELTSTVPILCNSKAAKCSLVLDLYTLDDEATITRGCKDGMNSVVLEQTQCGANMKAITLTQDWKQRWQKVIQPNPDRVLVTGAIDGISEAVRSMKIKMKSLRFLPFTRLWANYHLDPVNVNIRDRDQETGTSTHICYSHNDPHLRTFDFCNYEAQWEGEFILYKHKTKPVQVHIFTSWCNGAATCNCGAAVRSGRDVFIISRCHGSLEKHMFNCEDNSMTIHEEGREQYRIVLPTGTTVKIYIGWGGLYNVDIIPSPLDKDNTEGLCGNFDKNPANDLIKRYEAVHHVECPLDKVPSDNQRRDFVLSWRVPKGDKESLREGYNNIDDTRTFITLCQCKCQGDHCEGNFANPKAHCGYKEGVDECLQKAGYDLTGNMCAEKKRRKRSLYVSDILGASGTDEPEFRAPPTRLANFADTVSEWRNGWTEATAAEFCRNTVLGSEAGLQCSSLENVDFDSNIRDCVSDIKITGGSDWAGDAIAAMKTGCEAEITKNTTRWEPTPGTNYTAPPSATMSKLCPSDCSQHGTCNLGNCECDAGYVAIDCSIKENEPPVVLPLPSGGLCDMRKRPCESTVVKGDNFLRSSNLTCKVQYKKVTSKGLETDSAISSNLPAEYRGFEEVSCPLFRASRPGIFALDNPDNPLALVYHVSVSNNNAQFSPPVTLMAYDGKCLECNTTSFQCTLKNDTCRIDGMCYNKGDQHSAQFPCDKCHPASSLSSWTTQINSCSINGKCYQHGESNKKCQECNTQKSTTSWSLKDSWCYIDGQCVSSNEMSEDRCQLCSPDKDTSKWTDSELCTNDEGTKEPGSAATVPRMYVKVIMLILAVTRLTL